MEVSLPDGEDLDILIAELFPFRHYGDPEIDMVYRTDESEDDWTS